jgi:hypothetical protein
MQYAGSRTYIEDTGSFFDSESDYQFRNSFSGIQWKALILPGVC